MTLSRRGRRRPDAALTAVPERAAARVGAAVSRPGAGAGKVDSQLNRGTSVVAGSGRSTGPEGPASRASDAVMYDRTHER